MAISRKVYEAYFSRQEKKRKLWLFVVFGVIFIFTYSIICYQHKPNEFYLYICTLSYLVTVFISIELGRTFIPDIMYADYYRNIVGGKDESGKQR